MFKYFAIAILAVAAGVAIGQHQNRFYFVSEQHVYSGDFKDFSMLAYHDRDTGQEVVCAMSGGMGGPSCWLTGRVWK